MKLDSLMQNIINGKKCYYQSIELYNVGKIDESIAMCNRAIELLKNDLLSKETALTYNVLGILYNIKCNELVAVNYYMDGIDVALATQNIEGLIKIYNNMVLCLMKIEDYDNSLYYIEKCIEVIEQYKIHGDYLGIIRGNAAVIYTKVNNQPKAAEQYRLAKAAFDISKSEIYYFSVLLLKIMVNEMEEGESKEETYNLVMTILENRPLTVRELEILLYCMDQFFEDNELEKAEKCLEYMEETAYKNGVTQGLFKIYEYQMDLCRRQGDLEKQKNVALKYAVQSNQDFKRMSKMISESITERVEYKNLQKDHTQMEKKALTDQLTGLYNRHALTSLFENHYSNCREHDQIIGIAVIDVDYFKEYNDYRGHVFGDECLNHVADVLKTLIDRNTIIMRYGGDEFMILFANHTEEEIITKLKLIKEKVNLLGINRPSDPSQKLSVTQGAYIDKEDNVEDLVDLIRHADSALYKGKQKRGSICIKGHDEDILFL